MTTAPDEVTTAERKDLRQRRLRQVLVELDREPAGLTWEQVWQRVIVAVPLTAWDGQLTATGPPKGENDVRYSLQLLDKSGWLLSGVTPMRITKAGRQALRDYPEADAFASTASDGYKRWNQLRQAPPEPASLSLSDRIAPTVPEERLILSAADALLGEGLRRGGSAFDPRRAAWSAETVAALHKAVVERQDEGSGSFVDKVAARLAGANDDTVLLAAEMLALLLLPVEDWKPETKRLRVKQVLSLMADPVHLSPLVSAAMDHGRFNGGIAFKQLGRQLVSVAEVATTWWALDTRGRDNAWSDPWAWSRFLRSVSGSTPSIRAELCYLRHPGHFLPVVSTQHKEQIRDAFADEIAELSGDVDRDLFDITVALQEKAGGSVEYYASPFAETWQPPPEPTTRRAWLVRGSSVRGVDMVPTWLADGFVSLAASQLPVLDLPVNGAAVRSAVDEGYAHLSYAKREEKIRDVRSFAVTMQAGDLVVTTSGGRIHVGVLTGDVEQVASEGSRSNLRRPVDWAAAEHAVEFATLPSELSVRLKSGSDVVDLTEVADLVAALLPPKVEPGPGPTVVSPTELPVIPRPEPVVLRGLTDDEAATLLVGRDWLDELVDLLNDKRQVILYGPPGTGKTYLATKVAAALCPPENVRLVQFHPAYSYEDFFEGYRPARTEGGQVGFALKPGPLRRIVDDAEERPEQPFVLIVDEINRANLAKVFGELYFLLEYRDEQVELLYAQDDDNRRFSLPKNVFLVGTMNTADRSIALVDTAMRRRFAFLSLHPDDDHLRPVLRAWLKGEGLPSQPADLLDELNRRIPDKDARVGPSYLMNQAVATDVGLHRIWRTAILPLLEELHYGDESVDVEKQYGLPALLQAIQPLDATAGVGEPAGDVEPADAAAPGEPT